MSSWTIYSKDGVARASVDALELHDEWMAECFITVSVKSAEPIDFMVGDYIDYRNERYSINYDPSRIKRARRGTYGEGFVYDNIKFVAVQDELVRCDFCDIVLSDNQMHYTQLSTFPFYCETVDDLLDRIQANMEDLYPGSWIVISPDLNRNRQRGMCVGREQAFIDAYNQYIGEGSEFKYEKTGIALTVDNINCWEALSKAHSDFALNFIVRGRVVVVGTAGIFTANTFRYGKGNGLSEIEVIGDSEQKVVTRLRAYGSEQNLPDRYYAEMNARPFFNVSYINPDSSTAQGISVLLDNKKFNNVFTNEVDSVADSQKIMIANCEMDGITFDAAFELINGSEGCTTRMLVGADGTVIITGYSLPTVPQSVIDALKAEMEVGSHIIFNNGVNKKYVDSSHIDYATTSLPDNMAVNRLMLPGFPDVSLDAWVRANRPELIAQGFSFSTNPARPYIDSPNISKYGIRPSSIYFDGTDDNEDIHSTIEGMSWAGVRSDEVVSAEQMTDNGSLTEDAKDAEKRVSITIPYAGFELNDLWVEGASISMKDGMCGARDFKIVKKPTKDDDGNWICVCERAYDSTLHLYFPYSDFQIHTGDKFVLTGIDLPNSYVEAASIRLFDAAINALRANHEPRVTCQPRIDHIFMARQHDDAMASGGRTRSLHDTLKAGDMFVFQDSDLGINAAVTIDILSIKENGDNGLPTYEVTLRDEKQVSTIQKLQNKVGSMFSGSINGAGGGGGGYNTNQLLSLIENLGREYFLSRQFDDSAAGNIEFKKDITVDGKTYADEIISSEYTGDGMLDTGYRLWYEDGRAKLVIDDLVARGKFSVYELETRIMTHAGGDVVFSGAGSKIFYVEYLNGNEDVLGYTTINSPWMLRGKMLLGGNTALAAWSNRKKIQKQLTDTEKAQVRKFRCYVVSDDGTTQTRNWWHVHDLARSQTFDHTQLKQTSEGYYSGTNVTNTVYWRRVAGIGSKEIEGIGDGKIHDYFDLWNVLDVSNETFIDEHGEEQTIGYDIPSEEYTTPGYDASYNDWPAAGDDVVQFGNARDKDRQAMVTIEVTGGEPGIQIYNGVHTYNLANTKWVGIGYDATTKHAYADVFGDFYFGERGTGMNPYDGRSYLRFDSQSGLLEFQGRMSLSSGYGNDGKTLEEYIKSITWTQEQIEQMIGENIEVVQKQLDGEFTIWYGNVTPTTSNYPAVDWTDEEKEDNLYDLYYDKAHKNGYRWTKTMNGEVAVYSWEQIGDSSILASLAAAADAQDTADGKRRMFVNTPVPPYDEGDLWTQGSNGDILRCKTSKEEDESYAASDWEKASKYTDDTALNNFKANRYVKYLTDGKYDTDISNAASAYTRDAALNAVKGALKAKTDIEGGLMLTSLIALRQFNGGDPDDPNNYTTWAGISGEYNASALGEGIAAWYGGLMIDHEADAQALNYAKSLFRMDGSGYVAGGNITWDEDGVVEIQGNTLKTANFYLNGTDVTSILGDLFSMFELDTTTVPGTTFIKANFSLYSVGDVSAQGASSGGGGGGGGGATVLDELNDVTLSASLLDGQALVYDSNSHHWINKTIAQTLASLTDVYVGSQTDGQVLSWDATNRYWKAVDAAAAQIQADWNVSDSGNKAYIKNKPSIPSVSASVSGSTLTVSIDGTNYSLTDTNTWRPLGTGSSDAAAGDHNHDGRYLKPGLPIIELNTGGDLANYGGYIDFHFGGSQTDYTSRIIEDSSGRLNINGTYLHNGGDLTVNGGDLTINEPNPSGASAIWFQSGGTTYGNLRVKASNGEFYFYNGTNGDGQSSVCVNAGLFYSYGDVTALSDERKKDIVSQVVLTSEQIAAAPAITFRWKDKHDEKVHAGSIAQYWQKVLPEVVTEKDGTFGLNYGAAAMVSVVNLAREVVELRKMVLELKAEIEQLKKGGAS